ncbi:hypothetical protein BH10PLA1_BH10PLA1_14070 [soil metagenome]
MTCDQTAQLQAYHDGELPAGERAAIEQHLPTCAACTAEFAQLRAISAAFANEPRSKISQIARHRLHNRVDEAMERGLVRIAWSLSGVAAAVLIGGSVWLLQMKDQSQPVAAPPWVEAAASARANGDVAVTPAAQWYLVDASSRAEELP